MLFNVHSLQLTFSFPLVSTKLVLFYFFPRFCFLHKCAYGYADTHTFAWKFNELLESAKFRKNEIILTSLKYRFKKTIRMKSTKNTSVDQSRWIIWLNIEMYSRRITLLHSMLIVLKQKMTLLNFMVFKNKT